MDHYDFNAEVQKQILDALAKKIAPLVCPVCQHDKFTVANGWIASQLWENFYMQRRGKGSWVFVAVACDHCGNTLFIHPGALDLEHLVAPQHGID